MTFEQIKVALEAKYPGKSLNVLDFSDTFAAYALEGKNYKASLIIKPEGIELGEPEAVKLAYIPETEQVTESEAQTDVVEVSESALTQATGKTRVIKIISPGEGSSGYYSRDVIQRDGPLAFPAGTQMFINHQTKEELRNMPVGDLNKLAGVFTKTPWWDDNGKDGPGLYTEAEIFEPFRGRLNQIAPHIGVSIRAMMRARNGQVAGKPMPIVEQLVKGISVDFVARAGRGGKVLEALESARSGGTQNNDERTSKMAEINDQELATLRTQAAEAATLKARLDQIELNNAANSVIDTVLAAESSKLLKDKPKAQKRVRDLAMANLPMANGALDQTAFKTAVEAIVKDEAEYLTETARSSGRIAGMGHGQESAQAPKVDAAEAAKKFNESMKRLRS